MNRILFSLLLLFPFATNAQSGAYYGFEEAYVVKKQGDTLHCFLERAIAYTKTIHYKITEDEKEIPLEMQAQDIKAIIFAERFMENILIGNKERLMDFVTGKKIELFKHTLLYKTTPETIGGGAFYAYSQQLTYCLRMNGINYEINEKNYKEQVSLLFADCSKIIQNLDSRKYKFDNIAKLVDDYEVCSK